MVAHTPCSECGTANRTGLLFCVVCGRRLARLSFAPDRITAVAWPGPELQLALPTRPSALAMASFIAGVLAWSILPLLGAALAVLLALRAHEEQSGAHTAAGGARLIQLALWLGGVQLALALLAGTAMAAVALTALARSL
jgi:hypothetical protein